MPFISVFDEFWGNLAGVLIVFREKLPNMTDFGSPNVSTSVKKECVLVVFREKRTKMMFGRYFFRFSKSIWKGNFPARCVLVVFIRKCENSGFISPQKNKVEIELRFFVNLEGVLPVAREKVENETVATF